ncbi:MAG: hypothetical protein WDM89_01890 [Rhizomicrobium sp.]
MCSLRLPLEIKDLFREWLEGNVPDRAKHVMSLVRSMRGGKDYDSQWNTRMRGTGPYAEMLARRFQLAVKRLGLNRPSKSLDISQFPQAAARKASNSRCCEHSRAGHAPLIFSVPLHPGWSFAASML